MESVEATGAISKDRGVGGKLMLNSKEELLGPLRRIHPFTKRGAEVEDDVVGEVIMWRNRGERRIWGERRQ